MDGYRFAGKVRSGFNKLKSSVPIILLTAEAAPHEEMKKAGIDACLLHPCNRDDLYMVIYEEMLRHKTALIH